MSPRKTLHGNKFETTLGTVETYIRAGRFTEALTHLKSVPLSLSHPEPVRWKIASLARRLNAPEITLRLLGLLVRPTGRREKTSSPRERAEYGAALIKMGAFREGISLLEEINAEDCAEVPLFQAFGYIGQWNYEKAIGLLKQYLASSGTEPYLELVAQVNLASAFVHERSEQAAPLLETLLDQCRSQKLTLLLGNVLKFAAENAIYQGDFKRVSKWLDEAESLLESSSIIDQFLLKKWRAVSDLHQKGANGSTLGKLSEVRNVAIALAHWESVRHCDFHQVLMTEDEAIYQKILFGTPYPSCRALLKRLVGEKSLPPRYLWELSKGRPMHELDLTTSSAEPAVKKWLKPGKNLFRLLSVLCSDFYRPFRVAEINDIVFPNDYFNPVTSPAKVHALIKRLRKALIQQNICLDIREFEQRYKLYPNLPCALWISREEVEDSSQEVLLSRLHKHFPEGQFSAVDVGKLLGISRWAAIRILNYGLDEKRIKKVGSGNRLKYSFMGTKIRRKVG